MSRHAWAEAHASSGHEEFQDDERDRRAVDVTRDKPSGLQPPLLFLESAVLLRYSPLSTKFIAMTTGDVSLSPQKSQVPRRSCRELT